MSLSEKPNNSVELNHVPTNEELIEFYHLTGKNDPASIDYERTLVRPEIHLGRTLLNVAIALLISAALGALSYVFWPKLWLSFTVGGGALLLTFIVFIKKIAIWCVKVYQKLAPDSLRNRCRFEPSCSEYMILSLEKYGFIKGFFKGIHRICRCRPPNGGYDNP